MRRASVVPGGLPRRSRGCRNLRSTDESDHLRSVNFGYVAIYPASNIKIGNPQGILLDEFPALINGLAHQGGKRIVGLVLLLD